MSATSAAVTASKSRVLGAARESTEAGIRRQTQADHSLASVYAMDQGHAGHVSYSSSHHPVVTYNSNFRVGHTDIFVLLDEVLNNSIRSILIFGDMEDDDLVSCFGDADMSALAMVSRYNTSLLAITINNVDVGDHAVSLLCDALVRSRVRLLDFSDTFFDDEAGRAILALAHNNPNLRTVIIDNTLICDELMDEIDSACQYNDVCYPCPEPVPILPHRMRYCVRHLFQYCPDGDYCLYSHAPLELPLVDAAALKVIQASDTAANFASSSSSSSSHDGSDDDSGDDRAAGGGRRTARAAAKQQRAMNRRLLREQMARRSGATWRTKGGVEGDSVQNQQLPRPDKEYVIEEEAAAAAGPSGGSASSVMKPPSASAAGTVQATASHPPADPSTAARSARPQLPLPQASHGGGGASSSPLLLPAAIVVFVAAMGVLTAAVWRGGGLAAQRSSLP